MMGGMGRIVVQCAFFRHFPLPLAVVMAREKYEISKEGKTAGENEKL